MMMVIPCGEFVTIARVNLSVFLMLSSSSNFDTNAISNISSLHPTTCRVGNTCFLSSWLLRRLLVIVSIVYELKL